MASANVACGTKNLLAKYARQRLASAAGPGLLVRFGVSLLTAGAAPGPETRDTARPGRQATPEPHWPGRLSSAAQTQGLVTR